MSGRNGEHFTDVITSIVNGQPQSQIEKLSPWTYAATELKAVA